MTAWYNFHNPRKVKSSLSTYRICRYFVPNIFWCLLVYSNRIRYPISIHSIPSALFSTFRTHHNAHPVIEVLLLSDIPFSSQDQSILFLSIWRYSQFARNLMNKSWMKNLNIKTSYTLTPNLLTMWKNINAAWFYLFQSN